MGGTAGKAPLSEVIKQHIRDLHADGHGRNEIARLAGVGAGTVSKLCQDEGLTFDRAVTDAGTRARKSDLAARRAKLEEDLLADAAELRNQLWSPARYAAASSGKLVTWRQQRPDAVDQAHIMRACGVAIDKSLRLSEANQETTVDEAKSMLGGMMERLELALASESGPTDSDSVDG